LRLPQSFFAHRYFPQVIAVVDTLLSPRRLYFNRESPGISAWFFFVDFIAAIGEKFPPNHSWMPGGGILSVVIIRFARRPNSRSTAIRMLGIPLLFAPRCCTAIWRSGQTRRRRAAESEESRKQQLSMKDQLLSPMCLNELRTPLTAVYQFVTLLLGRHTRQAHVEPERSIWKSRCAT